MCTRATPEEIVARIDGAMSEPRHSTRLFIAVRTGRTLVAADLATEADEA